MDSETISKEECRISNKQEVLPKNRLKIRRPFSCKINTVSTASNSHANSTRQQIPQQIQPLIIHTFDPEIIVTEPCNFMWVVQRLTGSSNTRSSLCKMKKKMKKERQLQQACHADGTKATTESITKVAKTSLTDDNYQLSPKSASNLTSSDDNTASTELKEGICDTDDASPRGPFPSFEPGGFAADEWDFCACSFDSHHAYYRGAHDIEPFSADSFTFPMVLSPRELLSMSFLKDLPSCLPTVDEVI